MALDSLFRLVRYPLGNLLTMLAIAIALVLPAALWLTLDSAKLLDAELDESASLTVYLDMGIDAAQAARIEEAVSADGGVCSRDRHPRTKAITQRVQAMPCPARQAGS